MEPQPTSKRLLDQVRDALRLKHYSYCTEQPYVGWICPSGSHVLFHSKRHPNEMGAPEVEASLTHLAVEHGAAGTCAARPAPISEEPTTH